MKHELKVWSSFYPDLLAGLKTFELRRNDRDFKVGDTLELCEWNKALEQAVPSPHLFFRVTHLIHGPIFGLEVGWCILSIKRLHEEVV